MHKASEIFKNVYDSFDWKGLYILECGAHQQGEETSNLSSTNVCWYIEPNPDDYKILSNLKTNTLNVALTNKNSQVKFTLSSHPGNSSCEHSNQHLTELKKYNTSFKEIEVEGMTYDSLLKKLNLTFDVVVLDVEGHEKAILETWKYLNKKSLPKILCIECGYDWNERLSILQQLNYKIDCYYFNNCFLSQQDIAANSNTTKIYNSEWKQFIWNDKVVYTNECSYDSNL
jgi:FkbM family methyltransferase